MLGSVLTDTNGTPAGPFYQGVMTAPTGWTYTYTRTGAGTFQLIGASPTDLPTSNISVSLRPDVNAAGRRGNPSAAVLRRPWFNDRC